MKVTSLLLFILLSCSSEPLYVESSQGLVNPEVMHCLHDKYGGFTGLFRYSYTAGKEGHAKNVKILKTPFKDRSINACIKLAIKVERIAKLPDDKQFIQELDFQR